MPTAQDVKRIAEDIEVSYGERVAFLSDLFKETDNTLKTFRRQHQKMATDLWDFLTLDKDTREKLVKELRRENKKEFTVMAGKLANFLKKSRTATKQETASLIKDIKEFIKQTSEDVNLLAKETTNLLSGFHKEHQAMAKKTREELTSTAKRRVEEVRSQISAFAAEHKARSNKLRQELSSFQKGLKKTVKESRGMVIGDLQEARNSWQNLAKIMAAKREGKVVAPEKKIEEVPKKEVAEAAKAFTEGGLKEQAMRLISESPRGVTLPQLGKALRVPYIRLARPVSRLIKEGKVKKEDSQYFAV